MQRMACGMSADAGRRAEAERTFEHVLRARNELGQVRSSTFVIDALLATSLRESAIWH